MNTIFIKLNFVGMFALKSKWFQTIKTEISGYSRKMHQNLQLLIPTVPVTFSQASNFMILQQNCMMTCSQYLLHEIIFMVYFADADAVQQSGHADATDLSVCGSAVAPQQPYAFPCCSTHQQPARM